MINLLRQFNNNLRKELKKIWLGSQCLMPFWQRKIRRCLALSRARPQLPHKKEEGLCMWIALLKEIRTPGVPPPLATKLEITKMMGPLYPHFPQLSSLLGLTKSKVPRTLVPLSLLSTPTMAMKAPGRQRTVLL